MAMALESKFHVLAVDDNPVERKHIERLFKHSSYQVTIVESGSKALEFLGWRDGGDDRNMCMSSPSVSAANRHQATDPGVNLIITDYCMPGMTGYDLLKKIKESSSLRDIPVVIISSEDVPSRVTSCLGEGAEAFFVKPVKISDLQKIESYITKSEENHNEAKAEQDDDVASVDCSLSAQLPSHPPPLPSSSKRKALEIEESLSPERTRPRCSGITTVV